LSAAKVLMPGMSQAILLLCFRRGRRKKDLKVKQGKLDA